MRKNQEIQKELEELSPILAKNDAIEVYEIYENYFDELPISILKNCNSTKTANVPEHYFESLPNSILLKINKTNNVKVIKSKIFYIKVAVAAVSIGLLGLIILFLVNQKNNNSSPMVIKKPAYNDRFAGSINNNVDAEIDKLNEDEIISYLEDNGHDVNAALVACLEDDNNNKVMIEPENQTIH
jgi:hypothetical protein